MGRKISPIGLRVGVIRGWESRWYADKNYVDLLLEDVKIREFLFAECRGTSVSKVEIERSKSRVGVMICIAHPGVIIGTNGEDVEILKKKVEKLTGRKDIYLKTLEIANPDPDTKLVARSIADQLEQRTSFRIVQKKAIQRTMHAGAKSIKTAISSRLGGTDMARTESYSEGVVPLHTLHIDIDYAWEETSTTYGRLDVKVWVCRGKVLPGQMVQESETPKNNMNDRHHNRRGSRGGNRNNGQRSNNNRSPAGGNAPRRAEGGK